MFFWLSVGTYIPRDPKAPPTAPTNTFSSAGGTGLIHKLSTQAPQLIRSGDVIIFTTDDPEKLPIPSIDLLDMQWALHRATALSGAAEATDEELDPDNPIWFEEDTEITLSEWELEQEGEEDEDDHSLSGHGHL